MRAWITFVLTLTLSVAAQAGRRPPKRVGNGIDPCMQALDPKTYPAGRLQVKLSGREGHESQEIVESAEEIFGEHGIFQRLGYRLPHQQIIMETPADLIAALSGPGLYPLPHWKTGLDIIRGKSKAGVYEVVTDATAPTTHNAHTGECHGCRSLYKDSSLLNEQRSIFGHVAGHNDFNGHNPLARLRPSDQVASSVRLGEVMWEAMQDPYIGFEQVQLYYQFLESMTWRQDYFEGSHVSPEELSIENWLRKREARAMEKVGAGRDAVLTSGRKVDIPHASLQALAVHVANMPEHAPRWKREMAKYFEEIIRGYPGVVVSKSQNEGWATFSQFLFIKHSPWQEPVTLEEYASLVFKVTGSELYQGAENLVSNPYWIGLSAWMHLYGNFQKHPANSKAKLRGSKEFQDLMESERRVAEAKGRDKPREEDVLQLLVDRRFVDFAHEVMQSYPTDTTFFRYALTDSWFENYKFFLYKELSRWNIPWDLRQKAPSPEHIPTVVTSVRPERIREALVRGLFDKRPGIPMVRVKTMNHAGRRIVGYEHKNFDNLALSVESVAKTLFVYTQLHETTTSLETFFTYAQGFVPWTKLPDGSYGSVARLRSGSNLDMGSMLMKTALPRADWELVGGEWVPKIPDERVAVYLTPQPMRVEVDPDGSVRVYRQFEEIDVEPVNEADQALYGRGALPQPRQRKRMVEVLDPDASVYFTPHVENYVADMYLGSSNEMAAKHQQALDTAFTEEFGPGSLSVLNRAAKRLEQHVMGGAVVSRSMGNRFQEAALEAFERMIAKRSRAAIQLFLSGKLQGRRVGKNVRLSLMPQMPDFAFDKDVRGLVEQYRPAPPVDENFLRNMVVAQEKLAASGKERYTKGKPGVFNETGLGRGDQKPGDVWWKPPGSNGNGKGKKPGDKPGDQPGDQPDKGQGDSPLDPTEIEIPYEIFDELFAELFLLPNGRKLKGKNDEFELVRSGTRPNPNGEVVWTDTVNNYLGKGLAMTYAEYRKERSKQYQADVAKAKKEGTYLDEKGKPTIDQKDYLFTLSDFRREMRKPGSQMTKRLLKQGAIYSTESDIVTEHQDEMPMPNRRILVVYLRDMSGSMMGLGQEVAQQTVANVSQLARINYDHVEERFVGFDTKAYEYSREKFFSETLGGGTAYVVGYKKVEEIIAEYNESEIDIYVVSIGDSGSWGKDIEDTRASVERISGIARYQVYVEAGTWVGPEFGQMMQENEDSLPWFGYSKVKNSSSGALMSAMRELFGKHREKPHAGKGN